VKTGSLISWEFKNDEVIRGTIIGHPETTMFLINIQHDGTVRLAGAFIPDDEEHEVRDIEYAKMAAERYLLEWLGKVGATILSAHGSAALTWSEERPAAPGWWWVERISGERQPMKVINLAFGKAGLWLYNPSNGYWPMDSDNLNGWRWAGPLPEPEELPHAGRAS